MKHPRISLLRTVIVLWCLLLIGTFLSGCGDSTTPTSSSYPNTVAEGRAAVKEGMDQTGATAMSVALTDGGGIIWSETFGVIDKTTGTPARPSTLFGIGSVSKTFAAIATMILVDRGKISLDEPLVTYLPGFRMLSPEYRDITVRMLLNHSSGLPGGDMRNIVSAEPYAGFAAQVMEDLKFQRLKHAPGYQSVYNNDGYTMVENLVAAVTGQSYPEFVQQEIFTPLGMANTRFTIAAFADGSYAKAHEGEAPMDFIYLNMYGTGGIFSTAEDMSRLGMMLMNDGTYGVGRILSRTAINAMAQDQTLRSFNPLPSNDLSFGLGWDSVTQAGLAAVGVAGWQKGGDVGGYYASTFIVAPDEKLAVTVIGASNAINSGAAAKVAERILLAALVERGRLAAMPAPLAKSTPLPVVAVSSSDKTAFDGYYGAFGSLYRASFKLDDSLSIERYQNGVWEGWKNGFKLRSDGWFAADNDSINAIRFLSRAGRTYIVSRRDGGAGHYSTTILFGQRLETKPPLSAAWQARLSDTWVPVNDTRNIPDAKPQTQSLTSLLPGYLFAGGIPMIEMAPQDNNRLNGMNLLIPQIVGRDLADLSVEIWEGQEWLRLGSYLYRPLSRIAPLALGYSTVRIGAGGFVEWRRLPATGTITISGSTGWKVLSSDLQLIAYSTHNGSQALLGNGVKYLMLYGASGAEIGLNLAP